MDKLHKLASNLVFSYNDPAEVDAAQERIAAEDPISASEDNCKTPGWAKVENYECVEDFQRLHNGPILKYAEKTGQTPLEAHNEFREKRIEGTVVGLKEMGSVLAHNIQGEATQTGLKDERLSARVDSSSGAGMGMGITKSPWIEYAETGVMTGERREKENHGPDHS